MLGKKLTIREWSKEERPRDKLLEKNPAALCIIELLSILIGTGTRSHNAIELARELFTSCNGNLSELGQSTMRDLMKIRGIGKAKAAAIVAALELGRRRESKTALPRTYIRNSREGAEHIRPLLADLPHEVYGVLYLAQAGWIRSFDIVSEGGITSTVVDPRIIFRKALEKRAVSILAFHNHPSGSIHPSKADEALTQKLVACAKVVDIKFLDHIIIGEKGYFSFADAGMLN